MDALELELAKRDRPLPTEEVVEAVRLNALGYVGEIALVGAAPAVANAVVNATGRGARP